MGEAIVYRAYTGTDRKGDIFDRGTIGDLAVAVASRPVLRLCIVFGDAERAFDASELEDFAAARQVIGSGG